MAREKLREIQVVNSYTVYIGNGILDTVGARAKEASMSRKALIVTDDNVAKYYLQTVKNSLIQNGFEVFEFIFPHGEASKCAETYIKVVNFASQVRLCRTDIMIALGGGVTGDLTGFAAATYMRGINYIQVPTSLLAAVDSSVGGKTAIDLESGKNLVGAFYRPSAVICDVAVLKTLPEEYIRDGMAEVIKYAHIGEPELLKLLISGESIIQKMTKADDCDQIIDIISRCVALKAEIVGNDEFEKGQRAILNLGHTVGHAIEKLSNLSISHGHAVAAGMAIFAGASYKTGLCDKEVYDNIIFLNKKFSLPTDTKYTADEIFQASLNDKKNTGQSIKVALPKKVAESVLVKMTHQQLFDFIKAGVEN